MNALPSTQLLNFYRAHGQHRATTMARVQAQRDFFLSGARVLAEQAAAGCPSAEACITAVDEIAAACVGALAAGHGLELDSDPAVLRGQEALDVLVAELELSPRAARPLHDLRVRAGEIKRGIPENMAGPEEASDAYLAHQGGVIGESLVHWTEERLQDVSMH